MIIDRYVTHGLRANPFAVPQRGPDADPFFVDRNLPDPPSASSCTLVQVIGAKGAGKSSQLRCWRRNAPGPYHYVPATPYRNRWVRPPVEQLVYADEIDRMPSLLRWRWMQQLAAANATLVAGTHLDLAPVARRAGLAVISHHLGPADLVTVRAVLVGKVSLASDMSMGRTFELTDAEIAAIHRCSHGSLRTAEILAHETVAQRVQSDVATQSTPPTKVMM